MCLLNLLGEFLARQVTLKRFLIFMLEACGKRLLGLRCILVLSGDFSEALLQVHTLLLLQPVLGCYFHKLLRLGSQAITRLLQL